MVFCMKLISFDALRTLNYPSQTYIKPELFLKHQTEVSEADWVLFPEYWQLNTLVFAMGANIFPSLSSYLIGHNKIEMTRAFMAVAPEHVPFTMIHANTPEQAEKVWQAMPLPFVAKIPKSSMGEGVFLIENRADWHQYCLKSDVLYAQEYLPIDRDLRIVVIGDQVVGGYWRIQSDNGFHNNIAKGGTMMQGPLPESAVALVKRLAEALGIDHAGFDIAMVDNYPFVLEFNRVFGTQGVEQIIGDITPLILDYLQRRSAGNDPTNPNEPRDPNGPTSPNKGGRKRRSRWSTAA